MEEMNNKIIWLLVVVIIAGTVFALMKNKPQSKPAPSIAIQKLPVVNKAVAVTDVTLDEESKNSQGALESDSSLPSGQYLR